MTTPTIGSFEMVNVTETKKSGGGGESEAADLTGTTTCQFKVLTMEKSTSRNASGIWNYFGVAQKQNEAPGEQKQKAADRILCLICFEKGIVHVYKTSTSSGNLWRHLHRKHGIPIPKDRISGAAINLRANFEIYSDNRNVKRDFNSDDSTVFSSDLEMRSLADDEQSLDVTMTGSDGFRYDTESLYKDIGSMLITEVSKRPALYEWNCKTVANTKKSKRDELWQEIYESMGQIIEVNRLQKMWKNIRDRYKKLKNLELDGITEASTRYKYFDQLKFLETHTRNRSIPPISSTDSKDTEELDATFQNTEDDDDIDFENCLVNHSEETPAKKLKFNDPDDEISPKLYASFRASNFENSIVATYDDVVIPTEISTMENSCSIVDPVSPDKDFNAVSNTVYPDEFDLFGKLIAEKLRKLPTSRIDDIEIKILQLIRREEAESITQ